MKQEPSVTPSYNKLLFYTTVFIGVLFLLIPAFYNGYPIINPDDNTYLCSGFLPDTPFDRPITYGLLLWLTSLNGLSLFIAAFLQCWLVSWLLVKITQRVVGANYRTISIITILLLSICTSLSWISSEMIPDVYTPIALLSLALLLLQKENKVNNIILFIIYTVAVATHMSNVMIFFVVLLVMWLFRKKIFSNEQRANAVKRIYAALFLTLATIATMGSAISKSKHVFAMGALLEQGILKTYLDESCPVKNYKICAYKDNLPKDANIFLWSSDSPLYLTGGWQGNKMEYSEIVGATLTQPKYLLLRTKMSAIFTAKQLVIFNIGDGNFAIDTPLYSTVQQYLPRDANAYKSSKQHQSTLLKNADVFNWVIYFVVGISIIILIVQLLKKSTNAPFRLFVLLSVVTIIVNIWDCATMAQINGRYGCRVMWLIPFCAILSISLRVIKVRPVKNETIE